MMGYDTFFLTGTDEHGQKIERAAQAAGKTPQQFADDVSAQFRALWKRMGITNDDYIRTTEDRHKKRAQNCSSGFATTDTSTRAATAASIASRMKCMWKSARASLVRSADALPKPFKKKIISSGFRRFRTSCLKLYADQPDFIRPETRRNEVISFVNGGLRDLSISRSTFSWGIPVPDDPKHIMYVWLDALANYITAIGYGSSHPGAQDAFEKYWPVDLHMIGKEIVRFHCVYWPAFLMAAELPVPQHLFAHGWLLFEENKMSKTRGNIVRTETILDVLGADALRYFLLREIVFGQDGSFSFDALVQRYNADLANGLGNLASRTLTMINRYFKGEVPYPSHTAAHKQADDTIADTARRAIAEYNAYFEQYQFSKALEAAWGLVAAVDKYIVENEPWALGEKQDEQSRSRLATVLYTSAEALRIVTALAHPVMPDATIKIWSQLGLDDIRKFRLADLQWGQLKLGTKLGEIGPVFPRADKSAIERMQKMEDEQRTPVATEVKTEPAAPAAPLPKRQRRPLMARSPSMTSPRSSCGSPR